MHLIWVSGEAKYFCKRGWTRFRKIRSDLPVRQKQRRCDGRQYADKPVNWRAADDGPRSKPVGWVERRGWVSIRSSLKGVEIHSPVQVATRRKFCPHTCAGNQKERRSTSPTALRILAQPLCSTHPTTAVTGALFPALLVICREQSRSEREIAVAS